MKKSLFMIHNAQCLHNYILYKEFCVLENVIVNQNTKIHFTTSHI